VLRPLLRVASLVAIAVAGGVAAIRQPTITTLAYGSRPRTDAMALQRHVVFLTTEVRPRSADHPEKLDRAAEYIAAEFRKSGAAVEMQPFDRYRNVIARFGPGRGRAMIVGAHYDAFSTNDANLPGADDNASGSAGLLELARLLGTVELTRPIVLVAYSTEEPPYFASPGMGSAVHATSVDPEGVEAMICLEMIGYFRGEQMWPSATFDLLYRDKGDFIAVGGRWSDRALVRLVKRGIRGAGGVRVYGFVGPRRTLDASDHRSYWDRDIPAVLVSDTAYMRNPNYHTARDTADTLDYEKMARVVDGVFNAVSR
jgi:Zn-dependent M28 family amino/carboxypeptidase